MARERQSILRALRENQVVVVVGDTGSGKTTQLPKMALESARERGLDRGRVGCTQPRRIAASSVARRVAEELNCSLGGAVGYQVRFHDQVSEDTVLKFMTDGILLAETQGDAHLRQYHTVIIDEAHERSLNIDFLLGYLKRLTGRRRDLKVIISSATLDAGGFSAFFGNCPVIEVEGRTYPVEVEYLPPLEEEDLARHVSRAVAEIDRFDSRGDVLVFLPGEREIRECSDLLEGMRLRDTDICPLFARLGLADQERIFRPVDGVRRIVLATNVAETSLTIPGIHYVIDSGLARVSRWNPSRQVQRLQIEAISQASTRQRKGRCGRIAEGICIRLFDEEDWETRPEFSDPEIRRSSLAGVILRMKHLGLPEISEFPFLDPPKPGNISEGYRTLGEIGALDDHRELTGVGRTLSRLPVEPRLGRMLLHAAEADCLGALLVIVAGLTVMDPRERPAEKREEADRSHAAWNDEDSDFLSLLHLWEALQSCRENGKWKRNRLRKFCREHFINFRRVLEWDNLRRELGKLGRKQCGWKWEEPDGRAIESGAYRAIHEALISGIPRQFGFLDPKSGEYRSATGGSFAIFPGSGLFGRKKPEWLLAFEMVDTTRLWARRVARIDPSWIEGVAPHLCRKRHHSPKWSRKQGAVYALEDVFCGGIAIVQDRRVHFGRIDPEKAREVFIRDGLIGGGLLKKPEFLRRIRELEEEVRLMEAKTRRTGGLWHDDALFEFLDGRIPAGMCTAKAFHRWVGKDENARLMEPELADFLGEEVDELGLEDYPDTLEVEGECYPLHYRHAPGETDDGVTVEIALSQLHHFPDHLPSWGVRGFLGETVTHWIRSLPKSKRVACQPISDTAADFVEEWKGWEPAEALLPAVAQFLNEKTGLAIDPSDFDASRMPDHLTMKLWVCDDETGEEVGFGTSAEELRTRLREVLEDQFEEVAGVEWEIRGKKGWDFPDLPVQADAGRLVGYPGLVDEGSSVGLRLWPVRDRAEEEHRNGCARLFLLRCPDLRKHLEKNLPMSMETRMMLPLCGEAGVTSDQIALLAAASALGVPLPRSAGEFDAAAGRARGEFYASAERLCGWLDSAVADYRSASAFIEEQRESDAYGESVEDIERQIAWLWRRNFLLDAGEQWISGYPHYFRGIAERVSRLQSQPLIRDLEKMDRLLPFVEAWEKVREKAGTSGPVIRELGYAIEELRIALFAPGAARGIKTSEKRLEKRFEQHGIMIRGN